jgi:hypothetical protein
MAALMSAVSRALIIAAHAQVELLFDSTGALTRINAKRIVTGAMLWYEKPKKGSGTV